MDMPSRTAILSDELIDRLETDIAEAVRRVVSGQAATAKVAMTWNVSYTEKGELVTDFVKVTQRKEKGGFDPGVQARLFPAREEEEEENEDVAAGLPHPRHFSRAAGE